MSKTITSAEYNAWLEHPLTKGVKRSFQQSITDPENQPSQYGTVTLEMYEALEDQLAAAQEEIPNETAWQPIETAPKDGSWIVVTSTHNQYYRACVQFYDCNWCDTREVTHDDLMENAATHWIPMPKSPNGASPLPSS